MRAFCLKTFWNTKQAKILNHNYKLLCFFWLFHATLIESSQLVNVITTRHRNFMQASKNVCSFLLFPHTHILETSLNLRITNPYIYLSSWMCADRIKTASNCIWYSQFRERLYHFIDNLHLKKIVNHVRKLLSPALEAIYFLFGYFVIYTERLHDFIIL